MTDLVTEPTPPSASPNVTSNIVTSGGVSVDAGDLLYTTTLGRFADINLDPNASSYVLNNAGTIWDDYQAGSEVLAFMYWGRIDNSGLIVAHSSAGEADTLIVESGLQQGLHNSGSIYAISDSSSALTFADWTPDSPIDNSGTIAARGATGATALSLNNGGTVVNQQSGSILAEGPGATALYLGEGHYQAPGQAPTAVDVTNWGLIEAQSTDANNASVAIFVAHLSGQSMVIDNHGSIIGDFAIYGDSWAFSPPQESADQIRNESGGFIHGEIFLDLGDDQIVNDGQIVGYIDMGEGNDVVDTRLGTHSGDTDLGWGNDTYLGGSGVDAVTGNRGDDTISGGAGDDLLLGGWGNDIISGDAGNDGLYGEGGNDLITESGGDHVDAGDGDDRVVLGDYTFASVAGGLGHDVLVLPADARILSLSQVVSSGRISGFEEISLASGGEIVVHAADVAGMGDAVLTISAQGSGTVDLAGSWIAGAGQLIDGVGYDSYSSGTASVLIAHSLTVNLGSDPSAAGLDPVASGAAAPLPGLVPGADLTDNNVVDPQVDLTSDLEIQAPEHWTSDTGEALVTSDTGESPSLTNYGTMESSGSYGASVVAGYFFGHITNYGTMTATVMSGTDRLAENESAFNTYSIYNTVVNLQGNADGVFVGSNAESFLNAGTIEAQTSQSIAVGYLTYANRPGENDGLIKATSTNFIAVGVYTHNAGAFVNTGTITATGAWGAYGIGSTEFGLNLTNSGTITAHSTDPTHPGIGVDLNYASGMNYIANTGTITGDVAIQSENIANGNNLWLDNSGQINGAIKLDISVNGTLPREDVIINNGTINGEISLGSGRDVYDGSHGTQNGAVHGEDGNDLLIGTSGADTLDGGNGNDVLIGGDGDTLTGGAGSDVFVITSATPGHTASITDFANGADVLDLRALAPTSVSISGLVVTAVTGAGTVSFETHGSPTMSSILWSGTSLGSGSSGDDVLVAAPTGSTLIGGDGFDLLVGGAGDDRLDGGLGGTNGLSEIADVMYGGAGNDTYVVDSTADLVIENVNAGIDTIEQAQGYYNLPITLPENVENFVGWNGIGNELDNRMTGTGAADTLDGGAGNDTLVGLDGADSLTGGAGADTLTGGPGSDTFIDTAAGLSGDTIMDFSQGDKIVITDANFDDFTFSISGNTLTYTGGSLTLAAPPDGLVVARPDYGPGGGVDLEFFPHQVQDDLGGDRRSDVLLENSSTGQISVWMGSANGALTAPGPYDPYAGASLNTSPNWGSLPIPSGWQVAGIADFNGDGRDDILLRSSDGSTTDWVSTANGGLVDNSAVFSVNPGSDWHVEGTGDFNGDGMADVLWRNDAGTVVTFLGASNGSFVGNVNFNLNPGLDWHVEGTGDFNGDGRDDILWRSDSGTVVTLLGNLNGSFTGNVNFNLNPGLDWHVEGTGDFNGDGRDDILWRNDAGSVVTLLGNANGSFTGNVNFHLNPGLDWHIVATGDYNGDGRDDILWQNDSGTLTDLLGNADGSFTGNVTNFTANPGLDWHVQPEHALF